MKGYLITTGTVTYALKGRDLLRKKGYKAVVEKISSQEGNLGCGYSIYTEGNIEAIEKILRDASVKILKITQKNS